MSNEPNKPDHRSEAPSADDAGLDVGIDTDGTIDTGDGDPRDARIAELEGQVAQLRDQALRALAEAENVRRRTEREKEQTRLYAAGNLAKDLLNAVDNLRRALDAAPADREALDDTVKNLIVGVEMTERDVLSAFEKAGIKRIEPLGERFDPNLHQAMFEVENSGKPAGTVVQLLAPGYVIHDRLLRAAMVGVAKSGPTPSDRPRVDTTA
ncbi:MAG: nucleotide exchange factor GrpE [Thalassobaculum sp.]|uniref:nucleotide exchange factor GrpE n=1 Tax=Thalassobaculum sp. TaxID=2022740 RepID=UPI0032ED994B